MGVIHNEGVPLGSNATPILVDAQISGIIAATGYLELEANFRLYCSNQT